MGRQYGGVYVSGKVADFQFYLDRGQGYVKRSNPPTKERIMTDDAYIQVRKSMGEFAGSSKATVTLLSCFGGNWKNFGERFLIARVNQLTRDVIKQGTGLKGKRRFEVAPNLARFRKFELSSDEKFDLRFQPQYTVTVNADRNTAILDVGAFHTRHELSVPAGNATHFRVFATAGVLTDFEHVGGTEVYASTQKALLGVRTVGYSATMVCDGTVNPGFQVMVQLPGLPVLPADAAMVVCLGIEFMEIVSGVEEYFAQGNAMQIYAAY
jgi:hypothetical protein